MKNIHRKPSVYLRNFFYDTVTYDSLIIDVIARRVGVDRVLFGSDYPFGDADPLHMLDKCNLDTTERASVAGGNGAALLVRTKAAQNPQ